MTVLAMHPGDIVAIAAVILAWVGLRKIGGRRRRRPSSRDRPAIRLDGDG